MTLPPTRAASPTGVVGVAVLIVAGALFGAIAASVMNDGSLLALDERVATWLHGHGTPALTGLSLWVSRLHTHLAVCIFATFFAAMLARRGEWRWVLTVVLVVPGGLVVNALLKQAFHRARPMFDESLSSIASYSFPSGHTAAATLLYGVLAAYLTSRVPGWPARARFMAYAVLLVTLVGFSRMYLGVHYLSDVLAAASASTAWLVLCLTVVHARFPARHH